MDFKDIIGRKIKSVELSQDKDNITFQFEDGFVKAFGVAGECCSTSWIEHLTVPNDIAGAILTAVDDSDSVAGRPSTEVERTGEYIIVYSTQFRTDRGDIVLEYRNSSNGYYGGYLVELVIPIGPFLCSGRIEW